MSDAVSPLPWSVTFTYSDGERARLDDLAWRSASRGQPWEPFWGTLVLMVFVIGLAALAANRFGFVPRSHLPAVLGAAYAAFAAGVALTMLLVQRQYRWWARRNENRSDVEWEFAFSDAGFACKSALFESRIPWRSAVSVEPLPDAVFIWYGVIDVVIIPARLFASDDARKSFVAAVRACIGKAKAEPA